MTKNRKNYKMMTYQANKGGLLCGVDASSPDGPPTNFELAQLHVQAVGETRHSQYIYNVGIGRVQKILNDDV
jgi:hypothetical protein